MKPEDLPAAELKPAEPPVCQADIGFARDPGGATYVCRQHVGYPFHLGRVLAMPGDPAGMATVYLQSCSGGIFQGDDLRMRIGAGAGASVHVTTAASTVVHGMESAGARQRVELEAEAGALLEFLPDPAILFPRARLCNGVHVRIDPQATVILGDAFILHDPKDGGGAFEFLESETTVRDRAGKLLVRDRFRIGGGDLARQAPGVNGRFSSQGTLFVFAQAPGAGLLVAAMRQALAGVPQVYAGASALPNQAGAWVRVLAPDAIELRAALHAVWAAVRERITGSPPGARRK